MIHRSRRSVRCLSLLIGLGLPALTGWASNLVDDRVSAPAQTAPASAPQAAASSKATERWYVLLMQGQRAGWLKSVRSETPEQITSTSDVMLELKRDALKIRISMQTEFVETQDGKPISQQSTQKLGAMATTRRVRFLPDGSMEVTNLQPTPGGQPIKSTETRPAADKPWLTPAAAERFVAAELAKGAEKIVVTMMDPSLGEAPVTVTRTVLERTTAEAFGRTVPAVKWKSVIDSMASAEAIEYVGDDGETIRSEASVGGIALTQILADKDLALSKLNAPELLASMLVPVPQPIASPRETKLGSYIVTAKGELPELPSVAGQTFTRKGPDAGGITVRAGDDAREAVAPDKLAAVSAEYLKASPMLDTRDPEIIKLASTIDLSKDSPAAAAERLRRFVHGFITAKDMSVGFATASEVCRTRNGDCTEHGVLLATLLRAKGIPARVTSGLIYVDEFGGQKNVFGYHMWTQALIEGHWVNLDATLPDATPYDATHITLSTSSLNEGQVQNFLIANAPLIGRLKIEVVKVE